MKYSDNPERERILNRVLDARTLTEIEIATHDLCGWVQKNPDDTGIREAFEGLSLMRDIAAEQYAERTESGRRLVESGSEHNVH